MPYAVGIQTERLTRWKSVSPAAAWYFVHENLHFVQIFVNKEGFFRPAGACPERRRMGRYSPPNPGRLMHVSIGRFAVFAHVVLFVVQTTDRVTRVNETRAPVEVGFACGSIGRFLSVSQKCCIKCNIFVKQNSFFRPAGGDISFRVRGRVIQGMIGQEWVIPGMRGCRRRHTSA
jgi:hypothetical protein